MERYSLTPLQTSRQIALPIRRFPASNETWRPPPKLRSQLLWAVLALVAAIWSVPAARATSVNFVGNVAYSQDGDTVVLTSDEIYNSSSDTTSGTLRMELWAFSAPYSGAGGTGYRLAVFSLASLSDSNDGTLAPGSYFSGVSSGTISYAGPPNGTWYVAMLLTEYTGGPVDNGYSVDDYVNFDQTLNVGKLGGGGDTLAAFIGTVSYQTSGGTAVLQAAEIANDSTDRTTGTLRMELWAFSRPYSAATAGSEGYQLAVFDLATLNNLNNGTLDPDTYITGVSSGTISYSSPPSGTWYYVMFLTEYTGESSADDGYALDDYCDFSSSVVIGSGGGGGGGGNGNGNGHAPAKRWTPGTYYGLGATSGGNYSGYYRLSLATTGAFSALWSDITGRHPFTGHFLSDGTFDGQVRIAGVNEDVSIALASDLLTLTSTVAGTSTITAQKPQAIPASDLEPVAGKYTLTSSNASQEGTSYGFMSIKHSGAASISSDMLSRHVAGSGIPLMANPDGSVETLVFCTAHPVSGQQYFIAGYWNLSGGTAAVQTDDSAGVVYDTTIWPYTPEKFGTLTTSHASLTFSNGSLPAQLQLGVSVAASGIFSGPSLRGKINGSNGGFSGWFLEDNEKIPFSGVLDEGSNEGFGFFGELEFSGSVQLNFITGPRPLER